MRTFHFLIVDYDAEMTIEAKERIANEPRSTNKPSTATSTYIANQNRENQTMTLPKHLEGSLCGRCQQHRLITSGKGSQFLMCQIGLAEPSWPKYPPQPVYSCRQFQPLSMPPAPENRALDSNSPDSPSSATVNRREP